MKNFDVIKNFVNHAKACKGNSVTSTGDKLFSYNTIIAERINGVMYANFTKYTQTTSKAQNNLALVLSGHAIIVEGNVPLDTQSLADFIKA